jgi:hypothetical protein
VSRRLPHQSYGRASSEELEGLDQQLVRERAWYADARRYRTNRGIHRAVRRGALVEVRDSDDLQLIDRFKREPQTYVPYLTPNALRMAHDFGNLWRMTLWQSGIQDGLDRLAVTSMVRSKKYQRHIVSSGSLAVPDSTHCTGNAVDFDMAGYYRMNQDGRIVAHGHPARQARHRRVSLLINRPVAELGYYDPRVTDAALRVATLMHDAGVINRIHEFPSTPNACLHLAAAPDYPDNIHEAIDTTPLLMPS